MHHIRIRLRIFLALFFAVMVLGTIGFMTIEDISIADAFYFSIVTISTVGYGDIHPASQAGKALAIVLIIMGVGTFLGVVANATELFLNKREARARMQKINMVIGTFFSETGTRLLRLFSECHADTEKIQQDLVVTTAWTDRDFDTVTRKLKTYAYTIDIEKIDLADLRTFLTDRRDFLVRLLENPALLEHEAFTELLRAVFHVADELAYRDDVTNLPPNDRAHLANDMKRSYRLLVLQWIDYMHYLKGHYPYLFSLAMRTNPFDRTASPVVR